MNSLHSLTKVLATVTFIALGASATLAAEIANTLIPNPAAAEVSQALDRLTTANDKRVSEAIDGSVAAMAAKADDTVVTLSRPLDRNTRSRFARNLRFVHATRG